MNDDGLDFLISKTDLRHTKIEPQKAPSKADLKPGEIVVKVNRFALTANNITYAAFGDKLSYWNFFPTKSKDWGHLPAWGFAQVLYSQNDQVKEGEALFGYWPVASFCILLAEKVSKRGFTDGASHRQDLPLVYNQYAILSGNPHYKPEDDDKEMVFRPLFLTSFFLDDYLFDNKFFEAQQIIIASASSKTAVSLAYLLDHNRRAKYKIVGLTAIANIEFVESLGCYDRVLEYGALTEIESALPTAFIDMAGNHKILAEAHNHFLANLKTSISVGASHWEAMGKPEKLPGPKPELFFAPTQIRKRSTEWGQGGIEEKYGAVWPGFLKWLDGWYQTEHFQGADGLKDAYARVLEGRAAPQRGFVIEL